MGGMTPHIFKETGLKLISSFFRFKTDPSTKEKVYDVTINTQRSKSSLKQKFIIGKNPEEFVLLYDNVYSNTPLAAFIEKDPSHKDVYVTDPKANIQATLDILNGQKPHD